MRNTRFSLLVLLLVSILSISGCNASMALYSVTGVVSLNGQPVEAATVTFLPEDGIGHAASGLTDSHGEFSLATFSPGDGALAGNYKVVVTKIEGGVIQETADVQKALKELKRAKNALPDKYANPETSGFRFPVPGDRVTLALIK